MHDIRWIRENPEAFDERLASRGLPAQSAALAALDEKRRSHLTFLQDLQARQNAASKEIGKAKAARDTTKADAVMTEVASIKAEIQAGEAKAREIDAEITAALEVIPNLPFADVPKGKDEHDNVERWKVGAPRSFNFEPRQHFEIGETLGLIDFETATRIAGSRFVITKGAITRMERALANLMLDMHTLEHGYTETAPPFLVKAETAYGTGNLPKFEEDLFKTTLGNYLIPTAEVPVTNYVAESILDEAQLPFRYTAWTPCFRSEAGSAGRDTRGMIRVHQFMKVELVSITTPEKSIDEHERMLSSAEAVLKRLNLPFRTVTLCTGDMGFGSRKTYDLEVWLPGQNAYREISSCSNCGDFQARRMNARYRPHGEKGTRFVHTLNGSGVAVGRCLVAVLENYQNQDGSVMIPEALRPYMGGMTTIERGS